ncbi:MAG: hypothetical protein U0894_02470 [Pirellulales bacterium]
MESGEASLYERPATAGVLLERVENWRVTANEPRISRGCGRGAIAV